MDVKSYLIQYHMVKAGDLVIAAVSGGADSVCLLLILQELQEEFGYELQAVHVEHGIRGEESLKDADFVEELCSRKGILLRKYPVDVPAYVKEHGGGLEEAARKLRYDAFAQACRENMKAGYEPEQMKIALAHHMQDQAETVLFRLARGTGMAGLSGMEPVRRDEQGFCYIRPLLGTARNEVEAYLTQRGQSYCTDATNLEEHYARNRIRARVLPELTEVNAQAARHIAQTAELAAWQQDYIEKAAGHEFVRIARKERIGVPEQEPAVNVTGRERISLNVEELARLHPALQREILRQALCEAAGHQKDLTSGHVQQLMGLMEMPSGSRISLPYKVEAMREFEWLVLKPCNCGDSEQNREEIIITPEQIRQWRESEEEVRLPLSDSEILVIRSGFILQYEQQADILSDFRKKSYTKSFNYDMIKDGFTIRKRKPGDFFYMKNGHRKKLKQYLIEEKIPLSQRSRLWLIARESQVLWVAGITKEEYYETNGTTPDPCTSDGGTDSCARSGNRRRNYE